jgi:tetratricopeptide (TPR) repeat protein
MQSGFVKEAEKYVNNSLEYNPDNIYSDYLKAYILLAKDRNFQRTGELLLKTLAKDTTRVDVIQEIAKKAYYQRDFKTANTYYQKLLDIIARYGLELYTAENAKIAVVFERLGKREEAKKLWAEFQGICRQ